MVELEEPVGHAGDVVGHAAAEAQRFCPVAVPRRQVVGMGDVPLEEFGQFSLGRHPHLQHPPTAVDPLEQESLELPLASRDIGSMGDDPAAGDAVAAAVHLPHLGHGVDPQGFDRGSRLADQVRDLEIDQLVEDRPAGVGTRQLPVAGRDASGGVGHERQRGEFLQRHQAEFNGVVGIVGVVGDRVGGIDHLGFEERCGSGAVFLSCRLGVEHLAGEIEARELGIAGLQKLHDPQCLGIVVEAPLVAEQFGERVFSGVAERRMADVVGERQRLDKVFVEGERAGEGAGDTGHLEGVREPAAVVVAVVAREDLRLVGKPSEGGRVDDPVAVALVGAAKLVRGLGMDAARRIDGVHRPRCEQQALAGPPVGLAPAGIVVDHAASSPAAFFSCSQRASSDWGSTRTPATAGMKFTSPGHRGTRCQWR